MLLNLQLSPQLFWQMALLFVGIDFALASLLLWRIKPERFRELKWQIVGTAAVFWGLLSTAVVWGTWALYYSHFWPEWTRWLGPLFALLLGTVGFAFWWLSLRLPGNPVVNLLFLAGCESLLEHALGIYGFGTMEKVPFLKNMSALSVLAFAFFEYVLYWGMILGLAALAQNVGAQRARPPRRRASPV